MPDVHESDGKRVVIFKAEPIESDLDPFVKELENWKFYATVITSLKFHFINQDKLLDHLKDADSYNGLIFTSSRAVDAVNKCLSGSEDEIEQWKEKENYCIGESTSKLTKSLLKLNTKGNHTASSVELSEYILSKPLLTSKPFLFPCSNRRRDTIPEALNQRGVKVVEVICYETVCNPHLFSSWNTLVLQRGISSGVSDVLVFFSPSVVQFCHKMIKDTFSGTSIPKIVALGATTAKALEEVNLPCDGFPTKPTPFHLSQTILEFYAPKVDTGPLQ